MTVIRENQIDQVDRLTDAQLEEFATNSLTWDYRWADFQNANGNRASTANSGHAAYKDQGYPARWIDNAQGTTRRFSNRSEYLKFRLKKRLKVGPKDTRFLYDSTGKDEIEKVKKEVAAKKEAELKKAAEERAKKPLVTSQGMEVQIISKARIEEWTARPYEAVHFIVESGGKDRSGKTMKPGIWRFERAEDSPSHRICTQNAAVSGKQMMAAMELVAGENEQLNRLKEYVNSIKIPEGIRITGVDFDPSQMGSLQIPDHFGGGFITMVPKEVFGARSVEITAQGYSFVFRISDLFALRDIMGDPRDYELVKKEKKEDPPEEEE